MGKPLGASTAKPGFTWGTGDSGRPTRSPSPPSSDDPGEKPSAPDVFDGAASHGRAENTNGVVTIPVRHERGHNHVSDHLEGSRLEDTGTLAAPLSGRSPNCRWVSGGDASSRGSKAWRTGLFRQRLSSTQLLMQQVADRRTSLREAITKANAHPGTDTIVLRSGVFRLALAGADDTNVAGDLDITDSTVIKGAGPGATVIDAQRLDRVFDVRGTAPHSIKVTFQGLTIRNGMSDSQGGGGVRAANADLVFQRANVSGNSTSGKGGGIAIVTSAGTASLTLVEQHRERELRPHDWRRHLRRRCGA